MPIYVYECPCGQFEDLQPINAARFTRCSNGHRAKRVVAQLGSISTTDPDKEDRIAARVARTNAEVVKGITSGTMRECEDRGLAGDKMSRSAVADLNSKLDHARKMA